MMLSSSPSTGCGCRRQPRRNSSPMGLAHDGSSAAYVRVDAAAGRATGVVDGVVDRPVVERGSRLADGDRRLVMELDTRLHRRLEGPCCMQSARPGSLARAPYGSSSFRSDSSKTLAADLT